MSSPAQALEETEAGHEALNERSHLANGKGKGWAEEPYLAWTLGVFGPGLFVCLADTDAGCLLVAAQSGARWGYSLLPLQVFLIPVLFMAQDLTVRLGICTQQGHAACIRDHFGYGWCWFATLLLLVECTAAMVSEMSGIAAVGRLWGMSLSTSTLLAAAVIISLVCSLRYKQVEFIGICFGLFELAFVFTMFWYHPPLSDVWQGSWQLHDDPEFVKLISANIGAVIMPWMIYFQQSAVVARRLTTGKDLSEERAGTLMGSILTQLIMIGALVTMAATKNHRNLKNINDLYLAFIPAFGITMSKVIVSMAMLGGSLCAAFVVSLAATWALCEAAGVEDRFALDQSPREAPFFYSSFLAVVLLGVLILVTGVNTVKLNIMVELLDGLLMPVAVGFLFLLATSEALPPDVRVKGFYKWLLAVIFTGVACVSLGSGFVSLVAN
eukprot:TRINITY_DN93146_c0_g1_i1.p1 TRINITY_DN93146_c0_g1~~TRINITY_DN93146_c0_g1_i1.p1  ORF type:complete len:440 (+),score=72.84 TRINITY_DN93146_c0_g1_i1:96-1415(+)